MSPDSIMQERFPRKKKREDELNYSNLGSLNSSALCYAFGFTNGSFSASSERVP